MNNATETIVCYLLDNLLALITLFFLNYYLRQALSQFNLKFVCLSVIIFVWAVNHVKIDQLSQKLDMFFVEVILVFTPNIVNAYACVY